ncbi:MAG: hypothetical protein DI555_16835 [Novosphingobium pentaromativorans]|uniref:Uncharacterized protein n=1 Tax=Novosphingobium pentaromativorans TaxID=205844 RepID=A0A2W5Q7C7_9SPHN|nr:MAG: hypothetical protein DI555_16835 [Novosphingobium pentaromativorans]
MTRRDLFWRAAGAVLLVGATAAEQLAPGSGAFRGLLTLVLLVTAFLGLLLLIRGKKMALALRIERSRHRMLPDLIRARRRQRRAERLP